MCSNITPDELLNNIKENIKKLKEEFHTEVILLTYNPEYESPMDWNDLSLLKYFLEVTKLERAVVILDGPGGLFEVGLTMSYILRNQMKYYQIFVPNVCGSALALLSFKADKLIINKDSKITQTDPLFEYNGKLYRAINLLHSKNEELRPIARASFDFARTSIINMLKEKPSLFVFKKEKFDEFDYTEGVVNLFMNRDAHDQKLSLNQLKSLNLNVDLMENLSIKNLANELTKECHDLLLKTKKRFILLFSPEIEIKKNIGNCILID